MQKDETLVLDPSILKKSIIKQPEHRNPPPAKLRRCSYEEIPIHNSFTRSIDVPMSFRLSQIKRNDSETQYNFLLNAILQI